jgi:integrase
MESLTYSRHMNVTPRARPSTQSLYRQSDVRYTGNGKGKREARTPRHTAASLMLAMGTKLEIVSRVLGHSSVTVTADVYSHLLGGEKRAAAAAMMAALLVPDWGLRPFLVGHNL